MSHLESILLKNIAKGLAGVIVAGTLVATGATAASAHTPTVTADCSGVTVNATRYGRRDLNTVTVVTDSTPRVVDRVFDTSYSKFFDWTSVDTAHSYVVSIISSADPSGRRGWTKTFTGNVSECNSAAQAVVTFTPSTCDLDVQIHSWGEHVTFAQYGSTSTTLTVIATADEGYLFNDGNTQKTFQFTNPVPYCPPPVVTPPVVTPPVVTPPPVVPSVKVVAPKVFVGTCLHADRDGFIRLPKVSGLRYKIVGPLSARRVIVTHTSSVKMVDSAGHEIDSATFGPYDLRRDSNPNCRAVPTKKPVVKRPAHLPVTL